MTLTLDEAQALYDCEAKDLRLAFTHYFKDMLTFEARTSHMSVVAQYGTQYGDNYRYEVSTKLREPPATFDEFRARKDYDRFLVAEIATGRTYEWRAE